MRVLVTGDREWKDEKWLFEVLDNIGDIDVVIEGEARGVDRLARKWAESRGIPVEPYPAQWEKHRPKVKGRRNPAGPIRNQQMLDQGRPDTVIAIHDNLAASRGTKDMVKRAIRYNITIWHYAHNSYARSINAQTEL